MPRSDLKNLRNHMVRYRHRSAFGLTLPYNVSSPVWMVSEKLLKTGLGVPTSTYPQISVLAHVVMCPHRFFTPAQRSHQNSWFFCQISWVRLLGPAWKKGWTWKSWESWSTLQLLSKKSIFLYENTQQTDIIFLIFIRRRWWFHRYCLLIKIF